MTYTIRMGIPEMAELWNKLQTSYRDGTINKNNNLRKYYDYGKVGNNQQEVKTKADTIIDYTDNGLIYDENTLANPAEDANSKNSEYWRLSTDNEKNILDKDTQNYYNTVNTKLIAQGLNEELTAGKSSEKPIYLTLSKVLSSSDDSNKDVLTYNNYIEIIEQTNTAGRRSYHTTKGTNKAGENYTTKAEYDENNRIIRFGYDIENQKGNSENVLLSDVVNRGTPVKDNMNKSGNQLVLSIPGDIGNPKDATTLYWEPDSDKAQEVQIVPPFGSQRVIWTIIATISAIILAGGIYLINRKVLKARNKK